MTHIDKHAVILEVRGALLEDLMNTGVQARAVTAARTTSFVTKRP